MLNRKRVMLAAAACFAAIVSHAAEIGSVDTKFNFMTPDDSIKLQVFSDPKIEGVACYLSTAKKGGVKGAIGVAEDTSDASIDCRQVGNVRIVRPLKQGESVFKKRRSLIFKKLKVVRFCDTERNTIIYLVYSEKVIEGSPKNSVSAVPIARWDATQDTSELAQCRYDK